MNRAPGRATVTILDAPLADDGHGNDERDWTGPNVTRRPVRGCDVQPGPSMEFLLGRDSVLVAWTVFAPAGTVVNAYQHVEWRGVEYTIYGTPEDWQTGQPSDYVGILLQKWAG
jgi:hypothetical protein